MARSKSRCWWCGGFLEQQKGVLIFAEVTLTNTPGSPKTKTHKICKSNAEASMKPLTAQPDEKQNEET